MNPNHRRRFAKAHTRAALAHKPSTATGPARAIVQRYDGGAKRWQKVLEASGEVLATKRTAGPYKGIARG